jgi:hypothetical protein
MDMVADGKIGLINPPQHIITQSKGFTATVWSLYERNEQTPEFCGFRLFDDRELEVIRTYLPPYRPHLMSHLGVLSLFT